MPCFKAWPRREYPELTASCTTLTETELGPIAVLQSNDIPGAVEQLGRALQLRTEVWGGEVVTDAGRSAEAGSLDKIKAALAR